MSPQDAIRSILSQPEILGTTADSLPAESNLWAAGLDSLGCVNLMFEIEQRYGIEFPLDAYTREAFGTIDAIASLVSSVRAAEAPTHRGA
jgi:acyl carrier protein